MRKETSSIILLLLSTFNQSVVSFSSLLNGPTTGKVQKKASSLFSSEVDVEKDEKSLTLENPRLEGLAFMLDDGTRKSHSMAENTAFVTGFFKGLSTQSSYKNLLTSLYFIYSAMENAFDTCKIEEVQCLDDKELRRVNAISMDMAYFYGDDWKNNVGTPTYSTQKYVNRIEEIARDKPYLLIAHQYTRYLGDLFGGQMMAGMASRSLDLEKGKGVSFYEFDGIVSTKDYISNWYTRLNLLELTEVQKQEIVDEANLVFALNIGIFEELEGSPLKAVWTIMIASLKDKLNSII